jgi:arylsulfatase A-like enzyme
MKKVKSMNRRRFLGWSGLATASLFSTAGCGHLRDIGRRKPNVVYVFADQWRAQATGYAGDPNLKGMTPILDKMYGESIALENAVSTCPVCSPYRASLMTGQYPLTNGLFLNDLCLNPEAVSMGKIFTAAGYSTGYIGKWHLDGHGRSAYIPKERRQGFDYWKVLECTHNYNHSFYYANDSSEKLRWDGYDAFAQTRDAQQYIKNHADNEKPFLLLLSWGPPHNPYQTAPENYRKMFPQNKIQLRPNVEGDFSADLAGYYAHIAALDKSFGDLLRTIDESGLRDDTIVVFTSDHGDMLGSHGQIRKQKPWDEAIRVPFLMRYPAIHKTQRKLNFPMSTPDILPTLLGLCGIKAPLTVEGTDYSDVFKGAAEPQDHAALIECPSPFGEWERNRGGREYRGLRTERYTYVRSLAGPWLLYDNQIDPYQQNNLINKAEHAKLQRMLDARLTAMLKARGDTFERGEVYIEKWNYEVTSRGTVDYNKHNSG